MNERLGTIIKLIASMPGITSKRLHKELLACGISVSERTLAMDIARLKSEYGLLPSVARLRQGYFLKNVFTLSSRELAMVNDMLCTFGIALKDPVALEMIERIATLNFDESASRYPTRYLAQKVIASQTKSKDVESIIMDAVRGRRALSFEYLSPRLERPMRITAFPLFKTFYQRAWYLIVKSIYEEAYYPCRLDRVSSPCLLKLSPNSNAIEDVQHANYLISCGWGMTFPASLKEAKNYDSCEETVVRFDRSVAQYILEGVDRHPRAKISTARDGTGDVIFKIRLGDLWEFKQWVRSFGSKAWFLAPRKVVNDEVAELSRLVHRYQKQLK